MIKAADIPLSSGKWGALLIPERWITEIEWKRMIEFIEFLKPAIVKESSDKKELEAGQIGPLGR